MKNVIRNLSVILIVFLGFAVVFLGFAAESHANQKANSVLRLGNFSDNIKTIEVFENGKAVISFPSKKTVSVQLKAVTVEKLENVARTLANAEVVERNDMVVCMMVGPKHVPALEVSSFLNKSMLFSGKLHTVYIQATCANSHKLYPKDEDALTTARNGIEILEILAAELSDLELE